MKIRVLFLYGGDSVEHEISIISALQAMDGLDTERYEAIPCYVSKQGDMYGGEHLRKLAHYRDLDALLQRVTRVHIERRRGQPVLVRDEARRFSRAIPFDIVFPILHGVNGEDGSVAGFCRMLHLPFCESDVLCGAIGQDKAMQKRLLQQAGLPICPYAVVKKQEGSGGWRRTLSALRMPVILKPSLLGSSIGIEKCEDLDACLQALPHIFAYGDEAIAETCVQDMREFNCAILHTPYGYRVSAVEEVTRGKDILDYEDKYMGGDGKGIISTKRVWLKEEPLVHQVQQLTMRFGKMLGVRGVARVDFLYDPQQEQLYVNEINTIPGSLSCYLWAWEGVEFPQLLDLIIRDGLEAYRERRRRLSSYDTNVLQQYFDCETIETHGTSLDAQTLALIRLAQQRRGVIIFTDPDHPGEYIRRRVNEAVPGCKNAFIEKDKAKTPKKVGVEHASRADLEEALKHCYIHAEQPHAHIGMDQMLDLGLQGKADSAQRRAFLGTYYHLGRPNAKTLLRRLNMLGVQADEVKKVLSEGGFS